MKTNELAIPILKLAELENDICNLTNMVQILNDMLEDNIKDYETGSVSGPVLTVRLGSGEMQKLSFAWNDVTRRAEELQDRFYEILE